MGFVHYYHLHIRFVCGLREEDLSGPTVIEVGHLPLPAVCPLCRSYFHGIACTWYPYHITKQCNPIPVTHVPCLFANIYGCHYRSRATIKGVLSFDSFASSHDLLYKMLMTLIVFIIAWCTFALIFKGAACYFFFFSKIRFSKNTNLLYYVPTKIRFKSDTYFESAHTLLTS